MKRKYSWFGVALIVVGATMLLERADIVAFGWRLIFWTVVAVAGAAKLVSGLSGRRKGAIFWGMGFLVLGAAKVLDEAGVVDVHARALLALLMISIGLAFFLMLARNTRDWHLAIPGLFFAGLGGLMFLAELGYSPGWEVRDAIRHFWPVALILFGVSLLLNRKAA